MSVGDAAYAAAAWASGITQREIAGHFGYSGPALVCGVIAAFRADMDV